MAQKRIVKISADGCTVAGLHSDILCGLGKMNTTRASHVEFCEKIGRWVVEPVIGPLAGTCLLQTFERRGDAIAAEVELLTRQHQMCLL